MESALFQEWVEEFVIEEEERGKERGKEIGKEIGIELGKQEQKLETARKLLLRRDSYDEIMEILDLTMEEIEIIKL